MLTKSKRRSENFPQSTTIGKCGPLIMVLFILVFCTVITAPPANANEKTETGTSQLVTGAACFIVTPVYGAFKLVYAGAGAIAGGLTWVFTGGDGKAAQKVWDASLKGTYIITPDHLRGKKAINFVGPTKP